jgi:hypothetical protein
MPSSGRIQLTMLPEFHRRIPGGSSLEIVEVFTFAFKKEQFKIVVPMNHEPIRPLLNGFLEGSHKDTGGRRHTTAGVIRERINRDLAPHP